MANNLAGFMVWSLDLDDFTGDFCGQGKYPLLQKMNDFFVQLVCNKNALK